MTASHVNVALSLCVLAAASSCGARDPGGYSPYSSPTPSKPPKPVSPYPEFSPQNDLYRLCSGASCPVTTDTSLFYEPAGNISDIDAAPAAPGADYILATVKSITDASQRLHQLLTLDGKPALKEVRDPVPARTVPASSGAPEPVPTLLSDAAGEPAILEVESDQTLAYYRPQEMLWAAERPAQLPMVSAVQQALLAPDGTLYALLTPVDPMQPALLATRKAPSMPMSMPTWSAEPLTAQSQMLRMAVDAAGRLYGADYASATGISYYVQGAATRAAVNGSLDLDAKRLDLAVPGSGAAPATPVFAARSSGGTTLKVFVPDASGNHTAFQYGSVQTVVESSPPGCAGDTVLHKFGDAVTTYALGRAADGTVWLAYYLSTVDYRYTESCVDVVFCFCSSGNYQDSPNDGHQKFVLAKVVPGATPQVDVRLQQDLVSEGKDNTIKKMWLAVRGSELHVSTYLSDRVRRLIFDINKL